MPRPPSPDRSRSVAGLALVLCIGVLSTPAHAWRPAEHYHWGSMGYALACVRLGVDVAGADEDAGARARFDAVCRPFGGVATAEPDPAVRAFEDLFRSGPALDDDAICAVVDAATDHLVDGPRPRFAGVYGQASAIAADNFDEPEDFLSDAGAEVLPRTLDYWRLASENHSHFHPASVRNWARYTADALARLHDGGPTCDPETEGPCGATWDSSFQEALFTHAFAGHFLQDAFAAGHMGFNRPGSGATAVRHFHDTYNEKGRRVRTIGLAEWLDRTARRGAAEPRPARPLAEWTAHGDRHLSACRTTPRCHCQVMAASVQSTYVLLRSHVFGAVDRAELEAAFEMLPREYLAISTTSLWGLWPAEARGWVTEEALMGPAYSALVLSIGYRFADLFGLPTEQRPVTAQHGIVLEATGAVYSDLRLGGRLGLGAADGEARIEGGIAAALPVLGAHFDGVLTLEWTPAVEVSGDAWSVQLAALRPRIELGVLGISLPFGLTTTSRSGARAWARGDMPGWLLDVTLREACCTVGIALDLVLATDGGRTWP